MALAKSAAVFEATSMFTFQKFIISTSSTNFFVWMFVSVHACPCSNQLSLTNQNCLF